MWQNAKIVACVFKGEVDGKGTRALLLKLGTYGANGSCCGRGCPCCWGRSYGEKGSRTRSTGSGQAAYYKLEQDAPIADPLELENYDAIIVGASTRYGAMASQLKNFWDQTGPLWARGALLNKVGSVMVSTATQHGGAELALLATQAMLQHHGMIIVPLSYAYQGQSGNDVVRGGAPYGMTTTSDSDGSRQPSAQELEGAAFQGKRVAEIAMKLHR